jgi:hypothetical protein
MISRANVTLSRVYDGVLKATRPIADLDLSHSPARLHAAGRPARHGGSQGSASGMPGILA